MCLAGRHNRREAARASDRSLTVAAQKGITRGVTLIEMITVVAIIGLVVAISFPAVTSGIESLRITSASDSIVAFLNAALNRAERRQEPVEVVVSIAESHLTMRSPDPTFVRTVNMPEGVKIERMHPPLPGVEQETARTVMLYPGGAVPRIGVEIVNRRGNRRIVRVDPTTGVPAVEQVQTSEE
jgi:prepilin-type N-terminal cleavage/methylation domain-containing protein